LSEDGIRLVLFDCDGTLVDSQHAIVAAMVAAWRAHGLPDPPARDVRRIVGLPLVPAIATLLPRDTAAAPDRIAESYKQAFFELRRRPDHVEPLYPGAQAALEALEAADLLLGIATGKSRRGLVATLDRHRLAGRFVTLKTADDGPGKPAPDMVVQAMAEVGAEPRHTVVVGDTVYDVLMARNAGVAAIGVAWGYHEAHQLRAAGAARIIRRFGELPATVAEVMGYER
jgi:phosphoglycolate phosphatase